MFFTTKNVPTGITVTFNIHSYSDALWKVITVGNSRYHILTTDIRDINFQIPGNYLGCNYAFDLSGDNSASTLLGKNIYNITITNSGKNAECIYDANGCEFTGGDFHLTYDYSNDIFLTGGGCNLYGYSQVTSFIAYTGKECLELYLTVTSQNNRPHLEWNDYLNSDYVPDKFKIYRVIRTNPPSAGTQFVCIATVNRNIRSYTDETYGCGGTTTAWYKIKAYCSSSGQLSLASNAEGMGIYPIAIRKWAISSDTINYPEVQLIQNHPNPFNPTTIISYELLSKSFVTLKVYDLLGKEITTLVSEYKDAGLHEVEFTASDELPSGVYFYVLTANDFKEVKKMLLLR